MVARFSPGITDDLEPGLIGLVGEEAVLTYHAFVDDDDTAYTDQWVLASDDRRYGAGSRSPTPKSCVKASPAECRQRAANAPAPRDMSHICHQAVIWVGQNRDHPR